MQACVLRAKKSFWSLESESIWRFTMWQQNQELESYFDTRVVTVLHGLKKGLPAISFNSLHQNEVQPRLASCEGLSLRVVFVHRVPHFGKENLQVCLSCRLQRIGRREKNATADPQRKHFKSEM